MRWVKMERLSSISSLRNEELFALVNKTFGLDLHDKGYDPNKMDHKKFMEDIGQMVYDYTEHSRFSATKNYGINASASEADPNLIKALDIIRGIGEKNKYALDIHYDNVMARRGPHGLHLVITDPFSFS